VIVKLTITGSGTAANGIAVSLPVTAATTDMRIGTGEISDTGTNNYPCLVVLNTTSQVAFRRTDANPGGNVGADPNFALANTDVIWFNCEYEAA
jgi:hypothetical protein